MYYAGEVLPAIRKTGRYEEPSHEKLSKAPTRDVLEAGPIRSPALPDTTHDAPRLFRFEDQPIRVIVAGGKPFFVAVDVLRALGYPAAALKRVRTQLRPVPAEEKGLHPVETPTGLRQIVSLSETGLCRFLEFSGQPTAGRFRIWLEKEILPAFADSNR